MPKATGTAIVNYDEELRRRAALFKEAEAATGAGKFMSFRAGQLTFQGSPVEGNKVDGVILDAIFENAYYEGDFDADNPVPPVCFSFSDTGKDMVPHEKSAKPQNATCKGCKWNEFGTAEKGKGKACKNIRRLSFIPAGQPFNVEHVNKAELALAKIPVTSVGPYAVYVKSIADLLKMPPLGVITQIGCQPDAKKQVAVTFKTVQQIKDKSILGALLKRADDTAQELRAPYPEPSEDAPKSKKGAGKKGNRKY